MSSQAVAATSPESKGGHPAGLFVLFFAELWERFCYYGMRALLALYIAQQFFSHLNGDDAQAQASASYGGFTALVYALGIFGGSIADRVLGYRRSIVMGGLFMAAGEFMLMVPQGSYMGFDQKQVFFFGLSLLIVGNGLFKPNISSLVGKLYKQGDPRRDGGFTIFYMGINIGALLAPVVCTAVSNLFPIEVTAAQLPPGFVPTAEQILPSGMIVLPDYRWGFGIAGAGMVLGLVTFLGFRGLLGDKGLAPEHRRGVASIVLVLVGCAITTPGVYFLLARDDIATQLLMVLAGAMVAWFAWLGVKLIGTGDRAGGQRLFAFILLLLANTMFWAVFEQAGNSLNFFARDHVSNPSWWKFEWFQSVNSTFIILLGPVFAAMWVFLSRIGRNPSIPGKFGLALVQVGIGIRAPRRAAAIRSGR
jgi:POT family proton-dependent oligopeptide transporter